MLGKRGFGRVHLVDASPRSEDLRWVPRLPGRGEWARVLELASDPARQAAQRRGDDGAALSARRRCASTGPSSWSSRPGRAGPPTVSTVSPTRRSRAPTRTSRTSSPRSRSWSKEAGSGRRVLVYDGDGYFMAPGLAEKLAADGYEVDLATCLHEIAPFLYETLEQHLLRRRMHEAGSGSERDRSDPDRTRRVEAADEFEERSSSRRRRRARAPAALRGAALPRSEGGRRAAGRGGSKPSTGSATASRRS